MLESNQGLAVIMYCRPRVLDFFMPRDKRYVVYTLFAKSLLNSECVKLMEVFKKRLTYIISIYRHTINI